MATLLPEPLSPVVKYYEYAKHGFTEQFDERVGEDFARSRLRHSKPELRAAWEYLLTSRQITNAAFPQEKPAPALHVSIPSRELATATPALVALSDRVVVHASETSQMHSIPTHDFLSGAPVIHSIYARIDHLESLGKWLLDAEFFVKRGMIGYIPRVGDLIETTGTFGTTSGEQLKEWKFYSPVASGAVVQPRGAGPAASGSGKFDIPVNIPFINNLPLLEFSKVVEQNWDVFHRFRNTMQTAFDDINDACNGLTPWKDIRRVQKCVIEDGVLRVKSELRRIVTKSAILAASTTIGAVGLVVSAFSGNHNIAAILGSAGIGLISKQYSDYISEYLTLQQDRTFFLHVLDRSGKKKCSCTS